MIWTIFTWGLGVVGLLLAGLAWHLWRDPFACLPRWFGPLCTSEPCRQAHENARIAAHIAPGATKQVPPVGSHPDFVSEPHRPPIYAWVAKKPEPVPRELEAGD